MQNSSAPSYSEEYIGNITFMHTQNILVTDHIQFNFICRPQKHINHTINLLKVDTCKQIQLWPMAYLTYCPLCLMVRFSLLFSLCRSVTEKEELFLYIFPTAQFLMQVLKKQNDAIQGQIRQSEEREEMILQSLMDSNNRSNERIVGLLIEGFRSTHPQTIYAPPPFQGYPHCHILSSQEKTVLHPA